MQTIAQQWIGFEKAVMPATAGSLQRNEMRRAFYAGFAAALAAGLDMADESGENDDIGATMWQRLHEECAQFGRDIQAGRA